MKNVIIVGAGLGGLVVGNLLAKKGHSVTIFEAHHTPGGYTAGFTRKGYYFESGTISLEASATVFAAMREIEVLDQIDFVRLKTRFVSDAFDGIPEHYDAYKDMIYAGFPADIDRLDQAFADLDKTTDLLSGMNAPLPFLYRGLNKVKAVLPNLLGGAKYFGLMKRYGDIPSSEFAAKHFEKDSKLYQLFSGIGYPDMPAIAVGGNLLSLFDDVWTVKSGMQSWADVLAKNFIKLGGDLRLRSCVDQIITKNGAAIGVSCSGTVYIADYVISAGDYKKTFTALLDNKSLLPRAFSDNLGKAATSEGFFTVYLGLNLPNEKLGEIMKAPHVFVCDKMPGCTIYDPDDGEFFAKTSVSLYSPSMINPGLASDGKSSLMIQTMAPFRWMGNWGSGDREAYRRLKEKAAEALIDHASRVIPGLRECIDYQDAATPLTYERFTRNSNGASSAWSWNPGKKFYRSGMSIHVETPVKNLLIGSCWAMQIGGIPGALGAAYRCAGKIK